MAHIVQTANLATVGGVFEDVVDLSFSSNRSMVAFCGLSMIDSTNNFDRDNAAAIDIAFYDGDRRSRSPWLYWGDHWGSPGAYSNYHLPSSVRYGRGVRFRLRSFHPGDLGLAGFGVIWAY